MEILWKFWKSSVNNAGKIDIDVLFSTDDTNTYSIFAPFRIDFDILGALDDRHYCYGSTGWNAQYSEAFQFTYLPVDPIWGMKVKQQEYSNYRAWGGIQAWSTLEKNYLLRFHEDEYKGDPIRYVDEEDTFREDDVLWTTASTSGSSPLQCGPAVFVH